MFDQLFSCARTIARHHAAPSLPLRVRYLEHLAAQGMCIPRVREVASRIYKLSITMDLDAGGAVSVRELETFANKWAHRKNPPDTFRSPRGPRKEMLCATKSWMRFLGRLDDPRKVCSPQEEQILEFEQYLAEERGLAANTITVRDWYLKRFSVQFGFGKFALDRLTVKHVANALRMAGEHGWTRGGIQQFAIALRAFFTFAESRGWCRANLAAAAVGPRRYRDANLPQGPAWADVQRLLTLLESDQSADIRDRPIVLLLAIYGLRVSEVYRLTLDNLDWDNETLVVIGAKGGRPRRYPLTGTVGDAIVRYLREVRPTRTRREVFLALNAPHRPLTQGAIYSSIARRSRELEVLAPK